MNRRVLNEALRSQLMELEAQKFRVLTDVRVQFYEALAAQRRLDLIKDFLAVSEKGLEFAELRKQALEGSQLDVVQAKVLLYEIDLSLQQAQARFIAAWKKLAALAGVPDMEPIYLEGSLPQEEGGTLDWDAIRSSVLTASPEYQAALARVSQARANLNRQNVQPIPNVDFQIGSGYDRGTDNGLINLQVGAPIPIFNQNQGNICAARADYARATREVQRIADAIQARLASTSGELEASLAAVQKFSSDIIPNAEEGLRLAELAYQAGETSYVQVLIAQRMYFDANLQFIQAQAELGQARAQIDGYLLTGALDPVVDNSGDDSLRGLTFGQQ
ncbi:MAG: TolC family protein [bacterium]|nr:TolC family protein [bacterium]